MKSTIFEQTTDQTECPFKTIHIICLLHIVIFNNNTKTFPITTNVLTQVKSLSPLETDLGFKHVLGFNPEVHIHLKTS